jgi:hypothetical protein
MPERRSVLIASHPQLVCLYQLHSYPRYTANS